MLRTLTGSTTERPVQDGTLRGSIAAFLVGLVGVVLNRLGVELTADEAWLLAMACTALAFILGGIFDRYVRPRLG